MDFIRKVIIICIAAGVAASCGEDYDQLERDRTSIRTFLGERDFDEVGNVFRYVENSGREGRAQAAEADGGDMAEIYYEGYVFNSGLGMTSGNYNPSYIFATNRPETLDFLCDPEQMGINAWNRTVWTEEPIETRVGGGSLVEGVAKGLPGCREGDHVWMIFASDLGFGGTQLGTVPKNQILAYRIYVEKITKN